MSIGSSTSTATTTSDGGNSNICIVWMLLLAMNGLFVLLFFTGSSVVSVNSWDTIVVLTSVFAIASGLFSNSSSSSSSPSHCWPLSGSTVAATLELLHLDHHYSSYELYSPPSSSLSSSSSLSDATVATALHGVHSDQHFSSYGLSSSSHSSFSSFSFSSSSSSSRSLASSSLSSDASLEDSEVARKKMNRHVLRRCRKGMRYGSHAKDQSICYKGYYYHGDSLEDEDEDDNDRKRGAVRRHSQLDRDAKMAFHVEERTADMASHVDEMIADVDDAAEAFIARFHQRQKWEKKMECLGIGVQ